VFGVSPIRQAQVWLRTHPTVADAILAALILFAAVMARPENAVRTVAVTGGWQTIIVALSCGALILRRRYPVGTWLVTVVLGAVSILLAGGPTTAVLPALVAIYTLAAWTTWRTAVLAALTTAVAFAAVFWTVADDALLSATTYALLAWGGLAGAIGIAVRGQREVLVAAEERARIAEQTREEEAQRRVTEERLRIARELHDVVAHHISVMNVQAGVARHLLDSDPDAAREALGHIRESGRVVLAEMGAILGLLRTSEEPSETQPTPGLAHVGDLVDSLRRSGMDVTWTVSGTPTGLPPGSDLTAYRLVQESLTNAQRHGLGHADLAIRHAPDSVTINVTNPMDPGPAGPLGHGLLGMSERVAAAGGSLTTGPDADGHFVVTAELPARARA
jgi:signal transduction histidine kinase